MGCCKLIFWSLLIGAAAFVAQRFFFCCNKPEIKFDFTQDYYWGSQAWSKGNPIPKDNVKIRPFQVAFKPEDVVDFKARLANTKYVHEYLNVNSFEQGFPSTQLRKVVDHFQNKFDFNQTQKELNRYPQFLTQVEGIDVHFIHIKPKTPVKGRLPIMLVHGWPGSVYEYYEVIPRLSEHYELVVPSIPGYGFSEEPHRPGFSANEAARYFVKLMQRLGHSQFAYHGGDWGSIIGRSMAIHFPQNARAVHLSMLSHQFNFNTISRLLVGMVAPNQIYNSELEASYSRGCFFNWFTNVLEESGYMHLQATKPDTIGALLVDSPAGLTAYILEKFSTWVNGEYVQRPDGGITEKFTLNKLLTNVAIYWFGGNAGHSVRLYKESIPFFLKHGTRMPRIPKQVKFGYTLYPHELFNKLPRFFVEDQAENVVYYSIAERGSHFSAFEEPELASREILAFLEAAHQTPF